VHTFGKAVGQHGAAVLTNHAVLVQYLVNYCSPIIYSTSLPLFNILAIRESYECIRRCHLERDHLQRLIELFKEGARKHELPCLISSTCIQGVIIPTNEAVLRVSRELYQSNMHCFPIRAPTVATGSERLRIILHAHNTEDEVRYLCRRLADVHAPSK
jgi:8-amino-7-oxononanoate synthase